MNYSVFEKLNVKASNLGFGAMRFPQKDGKIDQDQVCDMIDLAMAQGVTYYDTAAVYGDGASEIALGNALKKYDRSKILVADKLPFWKPKSTQDLEDVFNRTLKNLQMDYLDFYLMHNMNTPTTSNMEKLGGLEFAKQKKAEGKIKYLGFSIHANFAHLEKMLAMYDWDFVQIQYNYLDTNGEPGQAGYEELVRRNIPIIIMEPLKGGVLTNLPNEMTKPFSDLGASAAEMAFRWLIPQKNIKVILSGMSDLAQVKSNLAIFNNPKPLTSDEEKAIAQVKSGIIATQKVGCTGCGYCMPCPSGVNIPAAFKSWNTAAMKLKGNWISDGDIDIENAKKCVKCGICMTHCPQSIQIPEMLAKLVAEQA